MNLRCTAACILALSTAWAQAATDYDRVQAGDVLEGTIGMGFMARDLPLPPGRWQVVQAQEESIGLTPRTPSAEPRRSSLPMYAFTLRNMDTDSPLPALILRFSPRASNVDWLNAPCVANDPAQELVDALDIASPQATLFGCAKAVSISGLRRTITSATAANTPWVYENLRLLAPHVDRLPDQVVVLNAYANQYLGRNYAYTFLMRQEAALQAPAYANHVRNWMNTVGRAVLDIARNNKTLIPLPTAFAGSSSTSAPPPSPPPSHVLESRVALEQIRIPDEFAREYVTGDTYIAALRRCIPQFHADSPTLHASSLTSTAAFTVTFTLPPQSNFFLLQPGTQGACIQGSATGYPILPGAAIRNTLEVQGPPTPVVQDWYRRMALNIAKRGETTVAFVHPDGGATIARLVVSLRAPLGFRHVHYLRKAGSWEDLELDDKFVHPTFSAVRTSVQAGTGEGFSRVNL